jgi:hypothetical protein
MRKGISLATDTIIYIILAVLVLTVLLFFFTKNAGEADRTVDAQMDRNRYCSEYIQIDRQCDGKAELDNENALQTIKPKISAACGELKIQGCPGDLKCIQNCCIVCPRPI